MNLIDKKEWFKFKRYFYKGKYLKLIKDFLRYSWTNDDILSHIIFLFLVISIYKLLIVPIFSFTLNTKVPLNTIISQSMSHNGLSFEEWWEKNAKYYTRYNISKKDFEQFDYKNGLEIGDFVMVKGVDKSEVQVGQVLVYPANVFGKDLEIVHRVVRKFKNDKGEICFETLGDNNKGLQLYFEKEVCKIDGIVILRIPYLGYPRYLVYKILKI